MFFCFVFIPYLNVVKAIEKREEVGELIAYELRLMLFVGVYFILMYILFVKLLIKK